MVRVLLCGDVKGRLKELCDAIQKFHAKMDPSQHFKAVFCVGEFTSEDMDLEHAPPIPVHFIDSGPAAEDLIEASPQGEEVSENLHFLGHFGVTTVAGLKVAFLSGRHRKDLFMPLPGEEGGGDVDDQDSGGAAGPSRPDPLRSKYGVQEADSSLAGGVLHEFLDGEGGARRGPAKTGPSWEDIRAAEKVREFQQSQLFIDGCYTPLCMERLQEEIGDSGGVDLLLTSEWPQGIMKFVPQAWPQELDHRRVVRLGAKHCSSPPVAAVAVAAEAKYHAVGLAGVFWRRQPWTHELRGEVVASTGQLRCGACRMVALGAIDGMGVGGHLGKAPERVARIEDGPPPGPRLPQKWLHGLDIDPNAPPTGADDATLSPWTEKAVAKGSGSLEDLGQVRLSNKTDDKEERKRWFQRFGCLPEEMQHLSDKIEKQNAPKVKKEKHHSLYKVSEKEKKRRKTGGDGHMSFAAKDRMQSNRGG